MVVVIGVVVLAVLVGAVLVIGRLPAPEPALPVDPDAVGTGPRHTRFRPDPVLVALVAAGGAIGGPARYAVGQLVPHDATGLPWATLSVNLVGAAVLGLVLVVLTERGRPSDHLRAFLGTGVCGAFTTFSTFSVETDQLVRNGAAPTAGAYVAASIVLGLVAVYAGMWLGRRVPTTPAGEAR